MQPKNSTYYPNGSGRDNYIFKNSGGFVKVNKIFNQNITSGSFLGKEVKKFEGVSPNIKRVNYKIDGTGRDIYAKDGQVKVSDQNMQKFNYLKSLRNYDSILPFRTTCNLTSQRNRSESPLRSKRLTFQERQCDNLFPVLKFNEIDEKQPKQYQIRIEKFKQMSNNLQERVEKTIDFQKNASTIKASQSPDISKVQYKSPLKQTYESESNPNQFGTLKQIQYLLNHRKLVV